MRCGGALTSRWPSRWRASAGSCAIVAPRRVRSLVCHRVHVRMDPIGPRALVVASEAGGGGDHLCPRRLNAGCFGGRRPPGSSSERARKARLRRRPFAGPPQCHHRAARRRPARRRAARRCTSFNHPVRAHAQRRRHVDAEGESRRTYLLPNPFEFSWFAAWHRDCLRAATTSLASNRRCNASEVPGDSKEHGHYFFVSSSCPTLCSRSLRPLATLPMTPGSSNFIVTVSSSTLTTPEMV